MKVAFRGFLYNANDIANAKVLCSDLNRNSIPFEHHQDNSDMAFAIVVPDNVELASDVYP